MANCLKTQLKETVQNDNLNELGCLLFRNVNTNGNVVTWGKLSSRQSDLAIVEFEDGSMANYSSSEFSNPFELLWNDTRKYKTNSSSTIRIRNKYGLTEFEGGPAANLSVDDFSYCTKLSTFKRNDLKGNINGFGKCILLKTLNSNNSQNLSGDIVQLVKAWIANGRNSVNTTGVAISFQNSLNIKFGNSSLLPTFGAPQDLYWESNQKIYAVQQFSTEVFCVGYTSEEIAANKAGTGTVDWSGKTVIKCD